MIRGVDTMNNIKIFIYLHFFMIRNDLNVVEKEDHNEETKNPASFINAIHHRNLLIPWYYN